MNERIRYWLLQMGKNGFIYQMGHLDTNQGYQIEI